MKDGYQTTNTSSTTRVDYQNDVAGIRVVMCMLQHHRVQSMQDNGGVELNFFGGLLSITSLLHVLNCIPSIYYLTTVYSTFVT